MAELAARRVLGHWCELSLALPFPMRADPGQFVHVACDGSRILRRPFSIFSLEEGGWILKLLVKPRGGGSGWLAERRVGDPVDVMGPLGRGFPLGRGGRAALVAGGIGIAPLAYLGRRLMEEGARVTIFWGLAEPEEAGVLPEELSREFQLHLAVEREGRPRGIAGDDIPVTRDTVLGLFRAHGGEYNAVYACGPRQMYLEWFGKGREANASVYLSWEERMACGVGACLGCAVPVRSGTGAYARACREGPVFRSDEIDWERVVSVGP